MYISSLEQDLLNSLKSMKHRIWAALSNGQSLLLLARERGRDQGGARTFSPAPVGSPGSLFAFSPVLSLDTKSRVSPGHCALAGVAEWVEYRPVNAKGASLIPRQGTRLGCRPGPQLGGGGSGA